MIDDPFVTSVLVLALVADMVMIYILFEMRRFSNQMEKSVKEPVMEEKV